ncbi:MAG TPA: glycosyltransferase [Anaerolineae bacterium]|nr:glycosyltransferase [Anaerolineae bacterium]
MRVAVFTPYLPSPPDTGGKIRSYFLLRALAQRFEVDLYTVFHGKRPNDGDIEALRAFCRKVILFRVEKRWRTRDRVLRLLNPLPRGVDHFITADSVAQARWHLENEDYDLLIADEMHMTPYAEIAPHLPRVVTMQKVDYAHYKEVAMARPWGLEKILDLSEAWKLRRYTLAKMNLYQGFLACSHQDKETIRKEAADLPALVVPNGVDLKAFVPSDQIESGEPTLLYIGSMNYYPNIDAVRFFFAKMYEPLRHEVPGVQVQIVGHEPPSQIRELSHLPGVDVTGSVPDVRPYYKKATVFIVPLRLGGGTRLKIVEAMAMDLPVVSTTVGAEGLEIHPGENILIADDATSFTESVLRLLHDTSLRKRLAEGGRRLARNYDWMEITKPWPEWIEQVAREWKQASR